MGSGWGGGAGRRGLLDKHEGLSSNTKNAQKSGHTM